MHILLKITFLTPYSSHPCSSMEEDSLFLIVQAPCKPLTHTDWVPEHMGLTDGCTVLACLIYTNTLIYMGLPSGSVVKNLPANAWDARDMDIIPGSERFPGEGNGNPLQYSCLENPMDRGAWSATAHVVTKSWTQLSDWTHTHTHTLTHTEVNVLSRIYCNCFFLFILFSFSPPAPF